MRIEIHAPDMLVAALALLGVVLAAAGALALLVTVVGRRLPEIEEQIATALLRDAAAWRARAERRVELAKHRPVLQRIPVEESAA